MTEPIRMLMMEYAWGMMSGTPIQGIIYKLGDGSDTKYRVIVGREGTEYPTLRKGISHEWVESSDFLVREEFDKWLGEMESKYEGLDWYGIDWYEPADAGERLVAARLGILG